jgi:predicted PurR-regulated permease PerM
MLAHVRTVPLLHLLVSLALIVVALYWAHTVFIPVALALLLTFLVNPVVSVLQRRGLGRTPAVILVHFEHEFHRWRGTPAVHS